MWVLATQNAAILFQSNQPKEKEKNNMKISTPHSCTALIICSCLHNSVNVCASSSCTHSTEKLEAARPVTQKITFYDTS